MTAPAPALPSVRAVTGADVTRLSRALAEAFDSDPPMRWFLPDDSRRIELADRQFRLFLRGYHLRHGECYMTDDPVGGAIWVPPGKWPITPGQQLRLLPGLARIHGRRLLRAQRGAEVMEANHPRHPHYYLETLGVEPAGQGRGAGSALLSWTLERCDRERKPAYLNAGSPRSRDLYERHGFGVTEEFNLPEDGPPMWRMWREPGPR